MNETYDKLIDIIAVDIKLAIELIKGQDVNCDELVKYIFENNKLWKIDTLNFYKVREGYHHNIRDTFTVLSHIHAYSPVEVFLYRLTNYLNKLKNEQN